MDKEKDLSVQHERIRELIESTDSIDGIYNLFKKLGYENTEKVKVFDKSYRQSIDLPKEELAKIEFASLIFSFGKKNGTFKSEISVFIIKVTAISNHLLRALTKYFSEQPHKFMLIVTKDFNEFTFVLPELTINEEGKSKPKLTKLTVNRKDIYRTDTEVLSGLVYRNQESARELWRDWRESFKLERVTESFFEAYKQIFLDLRKKIVAQRIGHKEAHEFSLQFMNRIMFIYFISKKGWLGGKTKFVKWLWEEKYKRMRSLDESIKDSFYENWLKTIFFEAFNNQFKTNKKLPEDLCEILEHSPYLNGGLFKKNDLDALPIKISDAIFNNVFQFYESYNFTIREDLPLEVEVAVDPQMIGYVYESLANVAEEIYDANDLGIFYTPKVEVEFMCRRSIVEYFAKNLPETPKEHFYHLLFDDDREVIAKTFTKLGLWRKIEEKLDSIAIVDPACGSGAFLVGMLNVLAELYKLTYKNLNRELSDFIVKRRIISKSLYGVDVMPWAIGAAELRLWLQLIVETQFSEEELRKEPLLPNLDMNLRIGDSLVQEIGGISFNVRANNLKSFLQDKLENLKDEKEKYTNNDQTRKFKTSKEILEEEIELFHEIIDDRSESLQNDNEVLEKDLKKWQSGLFGGTAATSKQMEQERKVKERLDSNEVEIERLANIKKELNKPEKKPFVWEIDFAEIFSSNKQGFDIVIGNPPYVRQEKISPPNKLKNEVTLEDRNEYKSKLTDSVIRRFGSVKAPKKRSDLYVYFYFHGLSLLNKNGTFCFITSNSWLDVEYGKELQEFLLKYVPMIAIYDNPKRSFVHGDVNTIISLFGSPNFKGEEMHGLKVAGSINWPMLSYTAKFVMFKKPFEEILTTKNLVKIEDSKATIKRRELTELVKNVLNTEDYRVFPITQEDLLDDGWEYPDDYEDGRFKVGDYDGNKWGGKYLRASELLMNLFGRNCIAVIPDGYGKVITVAWSREGKNKEVISKIEDADGKGSLLLKSPKDTSRIDVVSKYIKYVVFEDKLDNKLTYAPILLDDLRGDKHLCRKIHSNIFFSHAFHGILPYDDMDVDLICGILNCSLSWFLIENLGRRGLGGGAIRLTTNDIKRIPLITKKEILSEKTKKNICTAFSVLSKREISDAFEEMGFDSSKPIREQEPKPLPDRAELDNAIFGALGLTKQERQEVYWSVCELLKQRLEKADSLNKKDRRPIAKIYNK